MCNVLPDSFDSFFCRATGKETGPFDYQRRLAEGDEGKGSACISRLIDVPTGCGKTAAVVLAWLWNRIKLNRADWPRRLVFVLPMRVLVEQTEQAIRDWLRQLGLTQEVGLHVLMGGTVADDWHLEPERNAILIGTQDMILSRCLGRGYGAFRARWPVDFGLLNHDCLFVYDEVQLFDVGLSTSAQLHAFRENESAREVRPCRSWWMSATLQPSWLGSVDFDPFLPDLTVGKVVTGEADRNASVWQAVKPCRIELLPEADDDKAKTWARLVWDQHHAIPADAEWGRVTLAIVNTVERAGLLFDALDKLRGKPKTVATQELSPELRLVHSRFRGRERERWREAFLNREACRRGVDRIIVATQVVEAGVDLSASALITELAPWPSLVQRFGRAARYGGTASIVVVDRVLVGKSCLPYQEDTLAGAREALAQLDDASLGGLLALDEHMRRDNPSLHSRLYPYAPTHLLTRRELDELFDTTPDLTGADLDISRFIRSGDERDLSVFWRGVPEKTTPAADCQPERRELCPVPANKKTRQWLCQENGRLLDGCRAWVWDYLADEWRLLQSADLFPGRTVLVDERWGGYHPDRGFTGDKMARGAGSLDLKLDEKIDPADQADAAQDRDDVSRADHYKTISRHSAEVAVAARTLHDALALPVDLQDVFELAACLHDWGKAHDVFQDAVPRDLVTANRRDLAKAPAGNWKRYKSAGFRHELASTLAILELIHGADPWHGALLGPHRELLTAIGELPPPPDVNDTKTPDAGELTVRLCRLNPGAVDLLLYLVCTHHGKVRGAWHAAPSDQEESGSDTQRLPLRGIYEGDRLPAIELSAPDDASTVLLPEMTLHLDAAMMGLSARYGASWNERVLELMRAHGPFKLAYLEAIFRCADVRASKLDTPDPLLSNIP